MAKIKITIDCSNAAFFDCDGEFSPQHEVSGMLRRLAARIESDEFPAILHERNGNRAGAVTYTGKEWKK